MKTDRVFVLLLVVLLPLSGCFDGSTTGDAEGADAADGSSESTAVINNYYNNTTTSSESQERTWYSSGTVVDTMQYQPVFTTSLQQSIPWLGK